METGMVDLCMKKITSRTKYVMRGKSTRGTL